MCPWVTRLYIDRCLCRPICTEVCPARHYYKAGLQSAAGSAPWQARSHGHAPSHHIGYIRFVALPELRGSKICLKISASKLGGGSAHYMCHASKTASQRVRFAYLLPIPNSIANQWDIALISKQPVMSPHCKKVVELFCQVKIFS